MKMAEKALEYTSILFAVSENNPRGFDFIARRSDSLLGKVIALGDVRDWE